MDKEIQDIERLKKIVWSMQNTLNPDEIRKEINKIKTQVEGDIDSHLSSSLTNISNFQQEAESQITASINNLSTFQDEVKSDVQSDFSNLQSSLNNQITNFQSTINSTVNSQTEEFYKFKEEVNQRLDDVLNANTNGAMLDASNIETSKWIEKLLTGAEGYGDKIVRKIFVSDVGYVKFASGLTIQWGNDAENVHSTDYTDGLVSFVLPFSSATSYAIGSTARRSSLTPSRDTTFAIRNLTSTGFGYMWDGQSNTNDRWQFQWIAIGF